MTKYLVLIGDGMSDYPLKQLGGKTPLEAAKTPNMDFLAQNGICGWVNNVPKGMQPGSDTATMSILGYNPRQYLKGRGPFEAASLGIELKPDDIAFRCNLVTVKDGKMESFTAHHISTAEARRIFSVLNKEIGSGEVKFYPGLSYRNLLVISKFEARNSKQCLISSIETTPPHDITGKRITAFLPKGKGSELLIKLMNESEVLLHGMQTKATMIWPWGQGPRPNMPSFEKKFGKKAAMITAVHLLKGIAAVLGMDIINVPGATGYLDTNYKGKAEYALKALNDHDVVFVHVEAPDEAGHEGDVRKKIKAIEDFDRLVVGTILSKVESRKSKGDIGILVLPDHPTPIAKMTHTNDPVPFAIWDSEGPRMSVKVREGIEGYNEREIRKSRLMVRDGHLLLERFYFSSSELKGASE
jgi:2,3-bisphosphoglycerate-independent phosphoglycerate mutase